MIALCSAEEGSAKQSPKLIHTVSPEYPAELNEEGISGKVVVKVTVDKTGAVTDPEVVSATHDGFIAPTLEAVEQWRFKPGIKNGQPAEFNVKIPFDFKFTFAAQLERIIGRYVFVEIEEEIVSGKDLGYVPVAENLQLAPYPQEMIGSGKSGRVIVSFVINKEGLVVNPEVTKSDDTRFAISGILATCGLHYPVIRNEDGEPIFVRANIEYAFKDPGTDPPKPSAPEGVAPDDLQPEGVEPDDPETP